MNERYAKIASTEEVARQINRLAGEILRDEPERSPLFVALLRGAAPFSAKLMSEIARQSPDYHPELDYMTVSTYGSGQQAGEPHIVMDLAPDKVVNGRDVVIVDDVLDKGITTDFVTKHLQARGAAAIRIAVLCDKTTQRERDVTADYVGFTFKDNWLVGMGMDDTGAGTEGYRWLEEIWEIKP